MDQNREPKEDTPLERDRNARAKIREDHLAVGRQRANDENKAHSQEAQAEEAAESEAVPSLADEVHTLKDGTLDRK